MTAANVFNNKNQWKVTGISITESLTAGKMVQLKNARDQFGLNNVGSIDGRIINKGNTSAKPKLFYGWISGKAHSLWKKTTICF